MEAALCFGLGRRASTGKPLFSTDVGVALASVVRSRNIRRASRAGFNRGQITKNQEPRTKNTKFHTRSQAEPAEPGNELPRASGWQHGARGPAQRSEQHLIPPHTPSIPPAPASLLQLAGIPQVCALQPLPDPEAVFQRLCHLPGCVFLDSSLAHDSLGRYSFIAADPFETIRVAVGTANPLTSLRQRLDAFVTPRRRDLPPFQGGAMGMFAYELGSSFERLPTAAHEEFEIPAIHVGLYDVVVSFDRLTKNAWIISQGWPETDPARRTTRLSAVADVSRSCDSDQAG